MGTFNPSQKASVAIKDLQKSEYSNSVRFIVGFQCLVCRYCSFHIQNIFTHVKTEHNTIVKHEISQELSSMPGIFLESESLITPYYLHSSNTDHQQEENIPVENYHKSSINHMQNTRGLGDNVQHSQSLRDNVQHSQSLSDNVQHSQSLSDNVRHSQNLSDNVQHSQRLSDNVQHSQSAKTSAIVRKGSSTNSQQKKNVQYKMPELSIKVRSLLKDKLLSGSSYNADKPVSVSVSKQEDDYRDNREELQSKDSNEHLNNFAPKPLPVIIVNSISDGEFLKTKLIARNKPLAKSLTADSEKSNTLVPDNGSLRNHSKRFGIDVNGIQTTETLKGAMIGDEKLAVTDSSSPSEKLSGGKAGVQTTNKEMNENAKPSGLSRSENIKKRKTSQKFGRVITDSEKEVTCAYCGLELLDSLELFLHYDKVHNDSLWSRIEKIQKMKLSKQAEKFSTEISAALEHSEISSPISTCETSLKNTGSERTDDLQPRSLTDFLNSVESCPICKIKLKCGKYAKHVLMVHYWARISKVGQKDGPYFCDLCGKKFGYKKNLIAHEKMHQGIRRVIPYADRTLLKCNLCSFTSREKRRLHAHSQSKHMGIIPYKCRFCDFVTAERTALRDHAYRHFPEKPYTCRYCDHSCIQKTSMKSHLVVMHGIQIETVPLTDEKTNPTETRANRARILEEQSKHMIVKRIEGLSATQFTKYYEIIDNDDPRFNVSQKKKRKLQTTSIDGVDNDNTIPFTHQVETSHNAKNPHYDTSTIEYKKIDAKDGGDGKAPFICEFDSSYTRNCLPEKETEAQVHSPQNRPSDQSLLQNAAPTNQILTQAPCVMNPTAKFRTRYAPTELNQRPDEYSLGDCISSNSTQVDHDLRNPADNYIDPSFQICGQGKFTVSNIEKHSSQQVTEALGISQNDGAQPSELNLSETNENRDESDYAVISLDSIVLAQLQNLAATHPNPLTNEQSDTDNLLCSTFVNFMNQLASDTPSDTVQVENGHVAAPSQITGGNDGDIQLTAGKQIENVALRFMNSSSTCIPTYVVTQSNSDMSESGFVPSGVVYTHSVQN